MDTLLVVFGGLSLMALWWLFSTVYRSFYVDNTRQRLFALRDEFFDKAEKGFIQFDSRAYALTRTTLNGMIRFAHEMTLIHIVSSLLLDMFVDRKKIIEAYVGELKAAEKDISETARGVVRETHMHMHIIMFDHLVHTSFFLFITLMPLVGALRLLFGVKKLFRTASKFRTAFWASMALDAEARAIGERV